MKILLVFLSLTISGLAEDWSINGKDYHNVVVGQIEPDRVHISYKGGAGMVAIADLSPDMQKRFAYDPVTAKAQQTQRDANQAAADRQLQVELKTKAAQIAAAPKPPPTFEEKVAKAKEAERKQIEGEIKSLTGDLEYRQVQVAAHASDSPAVQKQLARDVVRLQNQILLLQSHLTAFQ